MDSSPPKIRLENLVKIYGEKHHVALNMFREGKTRDFILQATDQVLGLAYISFTINQGELFDELLRLQRELHKTIARY